MVAIRVLSAAAFPGVAYVDGSRRTSAESPLSLRNHGRERHKDSLPD